VTISQSTVSYKGWRGAGYILIDPATGAGAYLIGGGADGAIAFALGAATSAVLVALIAAYFTPATLGAAVTGPFLLTLFAPLMALFLGVMFLSFISRSKDPVFVSYFIGGFLMNIIAGLGLIFPKLGYLAGIGAGAGAVGTAGGCFGY
jgi:hypothetical protein